MCAEERDVGASDNFLKSRVCLKSGASGVREALSSEIKREGNDGMSRARKPAACNHEGRLSDGYGVPAGEKRNVYAFSQTKLREISADLRVGVVFRLGQENVSDDGPVGKLGEGGDVLLVIMGEYEVFDLDRAVIPCSIS